MTGRSRSAWWFAPVEHTRYPGRMRETQQKAWVLCWSGACVALERVRSMLDERKADAKVVRTTVEALWWVTAADEALKAEYADTWTGRLRAELPELPLLEGLHWVRNQVAYQIRIWEQATPPLHWAQAEVLAPRGNIPPERDPGRSEYIGHLQEQPALETLKSAVNAIRDAALNLPL